MPTLYITEGGSVVRKRAGSIVVTRQEDPDGAGPQPEKQRLLLEVEPHRVEMIGLFGRVHITAAAIRECLDHGISVSWFTWKGNFLGRLVPELSRTADLRLAQFHAFTDGAASLALARTVVNGKILNSEALVGAIRSNRPGTPYFGEVIQKLRELRLRLPSASTREEVMGIEGEAARWYFSAFSLGFSGEITFESRRRRPPPDPANALLSFCYVLLSNFLASLLEARGFDPYVGFFHASRSGRPSLALDLVEELRHPMADRFVLSVCNRRQLRPDDFEKDLRRGGVRMKRHGLSKFLRAWESYLDRPMAGVDGSLSVDQVIHRQVNRMAGHVRGRTTYEPLILEGGS